MAECNFFALFVWINDDPVSGNILRLSAILSPRRDYNDYQVGDRVLVKCPGFGNVDAVIGRLGDLKDRKSMAEVLKSTELFLQLLSDLDLQNGHQTQSLPGNTSGEEPVRKSPRKTQAQQLTGTSSKTGNKKTYKNSSNDAIVTLPQENLQQSPQKQWDNSLTFHEELDDSPRRSPRKSQSKASEAPVKVVKPKPVRKLAASDSSEAEKKKLKQVAEDLAITSLSQSTSRQTNPEDEETRELITNSLHLVHDGQTAFQPQPSCSTVTFQPSCSTVTFQEQEISCLKNRLDYAEYQIRYMWSEMQAMKTEMDQLRSSNVPIHVNKTDFEQDDCNRTKDNQSQSNEEQPGETHLVFSGFTKDQVMAELRHYTSPQKGTTRLFRMLFNIEETKGRSLFGMRKGNRESDARPALADKAKLKFLEDCVLEKWPTTPRTEIWRVIRHLLKPSRNSQKD